jgi:photosystem II stability/assembly factor-like uncharacterized protein
VRHDSSNQTLITSPAIGRYHNRATVNPTSPVAGPQISAPAATPPATSLPAGFFPESLSFVSQTDGYLWGTTPGSHLGVIAHTTDDGTTWSQLPSPGVDNAFALTGGGRGVGQIRFVSGTVGFLYGAKLLVTTDAGTTWAEQRSPGYIDELEAMRGRVWALVRPTYRSQTVRLYSASAADPTLQLVTKVPPMTGLAGTAGIAGSDSIALDNDSVAVMVGDSGLWVSPNGTAWHQRQDPCQALSTGAKPQSGLLSAPSPSSIVAACGYDVSAGTETKQVWTSTDAGAHWARTPKAPGPGGYLETLTAGGTGNFLIGDSRGGAQATYNGGARWSADPADGIELAFVGFIDPTHVVAVGDRADEEQGAFATSTDSGHSWAVHRFP